MATQQPGERDFGRAAVALGLTGLPLLLPRAWHPLQAALWSLGICRGTLCSAPLEHPVAFGVEVARVLPFAILVVALLVRLVGQRRASDQLWFASVAYHSAIALGGLLLAVYGMVEGPIDAVYVGSLLAAFFIAPVIALPPSARPSLPKAVRFVGTAALVIVALGCGLKVLSDAERRDPRSTIPQFAGHDDP